MGPHRPSDLRFDVRFPGVCSRGSRPPRGFGDAVSNRATNNLNTGSDSVRDTRSRSPNTNRTSYGPVPVVKKPEIFWPIFRTPESKAAAMRPTEPVLAKPEMVLPQFDMPESS